MKSSLKKQPIAGIFTLKYRAEDKSWELHFQHDVPQPLSLQPNGFSVKFAGRSALTKLRKVLGEKEDEISKAKDIGETRFEGQLIAEQYAELSRF